jgi:surface polysaccharide O-acyltransferase-like enzyme
MRIQSVDTFRVFAILAVVGIHAFAFWRYPSAYEWVQLFNRFAVPFFFISSGYFFTQKTLAGSDPKAMALTTAKHLALIFLIWSCIYALAPAFIPKNWANLSQNGLLAELGKQLHLTLINIPERPIFYLFQGPGFHLWFLPALICAQLLLAFALRFNQLETFILLAISLFIFALLAKPYSNFGWGIHTAFDARNGPFFSTFFVAMGAWLAYKKIQPKLSLAMAVFALGFILQLVEAHYLHSINTSMPVPGNDYLLGTTLLGLGAMLIALALPTIGSTSKIYRFAPYVLGIYVIHILVRDFLEPIHTSLPLYSVTWTLATFIISAIIVYAMSKIPFIRKTIS